MLASNYDIKTSTSSKIRESFRSLTSDSPILCRGQNIPYCFLCLRRINNGKALHKKPAFVGYC